MDIYEAQDIETAHRVSLISRRRRGDRRELAGASVREIPRAAEQVQPK